MTMREHLRDVHEKSAEHHLQMAKGHKTIAKCFGSMEKAAGLESAEDLAAAHEGLAEEHIGMGEFHLACCKSLDKALVTEDLSKAFGMSDGDAIRPDGISAVIGDVPQHVRAILRAGQKE